MMEIRRSDERGYADHGWLRTHHSFSFASYYDPDHMGFRTLRVINDDLIAPAAGFPTHSHQDMEIISYVAEGALEHRDSMGNGSVIRPGEVQRMTAGTGVTHSELNPSDTEGTRLLQIWIEPERSGLEPGYEQNFFPEKSRRGRLLLIASRDGRDGSVTIRQDAEIHAGLLGPGDVVVHRIGAGRGIWIQVVRGRARAAETDLAQGDAMALEDTASVEITARDESEILLFDLG
jgi:redox-sensitive bicupin YhaK (pirin superfamily)